MVNVLPEFEQAPELENVTGLPEPPPVAATPKLVLNTALPGACVLTVIVWLAIPTFSELEPPLGAYVPSPANDAATPVGYVPALMPERLALPRVAMPFAFVEALPTLFPLSV